MTTIRKQLRPTSRLVAKVSDGLGALNPVDKPRIDVAIKTRFDDSIDVDAAFLEELPNENRWDYLLGDSVSKKVVGLEPHSAKQDEVSRVIAKKTKALEQLRAHWKAGSPVAAWFWVASGDVHFPDTDRNAKRLAEHNITFVGRQLKAKHFKKL